MAAEINQKPVLEDGQQSGAKSTTDLLRPSPDAYKDYTEKQKAIQKPQDNVLAKDGSGNFAKDLIIQPLFQSTDNKKTDEKFNLAPRNYEHTQQSETGTMNFTYNKDGSTDGYFRSHSAYVGNDGKTTQYIEKHWGKDAKENYVATVTKFGDGSKAIDYDNGVKLIVQNDGSGRVESAKKEGAYQITNFDSQHRKGSVIDISTDTAGTVTETFNGKSIRQTFADGTRFEKAVNEDGSHEERHFNKYGRLTGDKWFDKSGSELSERKWFDKSGNTIATATHDSKGNIVQSFAANNASRIIHPDGSTEEKRTDKYGSRYERNYNEKGLNTERKRFDADGKELGSIRIKGVSDKFAKEALALYDALPEHVRNDLEQAGYSLTIGPHMTHPDMLPDLAGVQPRGWPPGTTWDNAEGTVYRDERKMIYIAEHVQKDGGWIAISQLRTRATVAHESGHAIDTIWGKDNEFFSASKEFKAAYEKDIANLNQLESDKFAYELQQGDAGREELFADLFGLYNSGASSRATIAGGGYDDYYDQHRARAFPEVTALMQRQLEQRKALYANARRMNNDKSTAS